MRYEGAPVARIQSATRDAFLNLVQFAIDESVDFVLIAGDLWDCDWPDAAPGLFFIHQAARLAKADIPIYVVKGNHDAHSQLTSSIRHWPENVKFFKHREPHTFRLEGLNVAIHGQSYAQQQVTTDLSASFPPPIAGMFNIGMLHTCLDDGGTDYAPAAHDRLVSHGYNYWALGHLHQRQDRSKEGVRIAFPGNIQGRSIKEIGPKGCLLISVDDEGGISSQFEALDVLRWQLLTIEGEEDNIEDEVRSGLAAAVADAAGRLLAVRLDLVGALRQGLDLRDRLEAVAVEVGDVWLEKISVRPNLKPQHVFQRTAQTAEIRKELEELIQTVQSNPKLLADWMEDFSKLRLHLAGELEETDSARRLIDKNEFASMVAKIGAVL